MLRGGNLNAHLNNFCTPVTYRISQSYMLQGQQGALHHLGFQNPICHVEVILTLWDVLRCSGTFRDALGALGDALGRSGTFWRRSGDALGRCFGDTLGTSWDDDVDADQPDQPRAVMRSGPGLRLRRLRLCWSV